MKRYILLGMSFIALNLCHLYAQQLPKGEGKFTFTEYAPFSERPVDVYYYISPTGDLETMPVVFVFQGADRGVEYLVEFWKKAAEERQFIFVLPHFDLQLYPLEDYQETGILTADRKHAKPQYLQTSALIDEIFNYIQKYTGTKATKYIMYGHSAGGQFIHRFMLFYDSPYVEKAIVGSPGWYTFPDKEQSFPYGVAGIPYVDGETLRRYLSKDIVIQLGKADTVREPYLRKTPEAEAQGGNRLERGRAFYAYARQLAADNNWSFYWRKEEVEGVGHNSVRMAENAIPTLLSGSIRLSPQPEAITTRFYPAPEKEYHTPTLRKPVTEGLASLTEITRYLGTLVEKHPDHVTLSALGISTEGREIPVLYFGSGKDKHKIRVWIQAGLHGNEPAGPEAVCMLADYLLNDAEGQKLLTHFELALVPVANVDGYATQNRMSGNGLDLNRDQSKLADPVSVLLKKAYISWAPEVALDIHEFTPWRKDYNAFFHKPVAIYEDVLFLPTGHLNVSEPIRDFSLNVIQRSAAEALMAKGYTWGYYFTSKVEADRLWLSKGAGSPQSSSTNFALSNAVSLFIEIRGIGLGRTSFERRTETGFIVAANMLETCYNHKEKLKSTIRKAIAATKKGDKPAYVSFKGKESLYTAHFVDFAQNDTFSATLPALDMLECEPVITRLRPKAYILTDTCRNAVRILEALGADIKRAPKAFIRNVEEYTVTEYEKSAMAWEMIYPVKVKTGTKKIRKTFPAGSYIVSPNQKAGNYIVTLLEPESINGFIPFGVIETQLGTTLPVYRQIK
jgi:hypothetical protein